MRFLVDANLPRSATALLRDLGHEAVDVRDIGMGGATDDVWLELLTGRLAIVGPSRVRFRPGP